MVTIRRESIFLKCKKCGKLHLYEYFSGRFDKNVDNVECPTCGEIMNDSNILTTI